MQVYSVLAFDSFEQESLVLVVPAVYRLLFLTLSLFRLRFLYTVTAINIWIANFRLLGKFRGVNPLTKCIVMTRKLVAFICYRHDMWFVTRTHIMGVTMYFFTAKCSTGVTNICRRLMKIIAQCKCGYFNIDTVKRLHCGKKKENKKTAQQSI